MRERVSDERAAELKRDVEGSVATAQRGVPCQASWGCCDADDALLLLADRADRKAWISRAEDAMYAILQGFTVDEDTGLYYDSNAQRLADLLAAAQRDAPA